MPAGGELEVCHGFSAGGDDDAGDDDTGAGMDCECRVAPRGSALPGVSVLIGLLFFFFTRVRIRLP